jgi:hypothetical protein
MLCPDMIFKSIRNIELPDVDKECLWCYECNTFYVMEWVEDDSVSWVTFDRWVLRMKVVQPIG